MRDDIYLGGVHAYHYGAAEPARYTVVIAHGIGGHGGTYDVFCEPLAARGADVYSVDLPGHGFARNERGNFRFIEWLEDIDEAARILKARSDRKLFVLGSSQGSAAAFHSLAFSDAVDGAITMGIILNHVSVGGESGAARVRSTMVGREADQIAEQEGDSRRIDLRTAIDWDRDYAQEESGVLAKKLQDPLRAWSYGFASLHSYWNYRPQVPPSENRKPVLITAGEDDRLVPPNYVRACYAEIGGPKQLQMIAGAGHQLMTYYTDQYVAVVDAWITDQLRAMESLAAQHVRD